MGRTKLHALARSLTLLASVGAPCLAHAADLLPPPPPPPPPMPVPVDVGGGWYLRGDVGVGAAEFQDVVVRADLPPAYAVNKPVLGDQFFAGAGVGYEFNSFLRGDITGEYRGGGQIGFSDQYNAFDANGDQILNKDGSPYQGVNLYHGKLRSIVVLANGYLDLGTWCGFTPYIGGGVGSAFHQVSGFTDIGAGAAAGGFGMAQAKNSTSLAWAAQAGISYTVTPRFKVDVGYRYIDMGTATTGAVNCINNGCATPATYKLKDITSHDVKIGVRYLLGGGVAEAPLPPLAPAYEPGPIIRKY